MNFDRRIVVHLMWGGDNPEVIQLVSWFLIPPPFGDGAFKATIAPTTPWSENAIVQANKRYSSIYGENCVNWTHNPTNPIYREALDASDAWKLFRTYLTNTWGKIDSKGLVLIPCTDSLIQSLYLLKTLHTSFAKIINEEAKKNYSWPFI